MSPGFRPLRPEHHPAEDTLLRLASGLLPPGRSVVAIAHLPFCAACREAVRTYEAIGGTVLVDMPPAELAPDAVNRTLAHLGAPALAVPRMATASAIRSLIPLADPLRGMARSGWRWIGPGIRRIILDVPGAGPHEQVYLLRIAPGQKMPGHGHGGWEATCVLSGRFSDATGTYGPGDLAEMDSDTTHQPIAGIDESCVCLIATEGRLRMRGLLARAAQVLAGV